MTQEQWQNTIADYMGQLIRQGEDRVAAKAKAEYATMCKPTCQPECRCGEKIGDLRHQVISLTTANEALRLDRDNEKSIRNDYIKDRDWFRDRSEERLQRAVAAEKRVAELEAVKNILGNSLDAALARVSDLEREAHGDAEVFAQRNLRIAELEHRITEMEADVASVCPVGVTVVQYVEKLNRRIRGSEVMIRDYQRDMKAGNEAWEKLEKESTEAAERAAKVEDLAKRMVEWSHCLGSGNWTQFENEARELGVYNARNTNVE